MNIPALLRSAAALLLVLCSHPATAQDIAAPMSLSNVRFWAYQIQGLTDPGAIEALAASRYDMLVIEPTRTDWTSDDRSFDAPGAVARLKASPASDGVHRKLVIAYIDIGQAEDWRWYWSWSRERPRDGRIPPDWPGYVLAPDPDGWEGNYVVRYWDPAWKALLLQGLEPSPSLTRGRAWNSVLDEVLRDGFDGVYLDWVEAYEHELVMAAAESEGRDPAQEMVRLIREIRDYGRERDPDFLVIQQNAAWLLDERPELASVIDAVAQECVFFESAATDDWDDPAGCDTPTNPELSAEYVEALAMYHDAGIPVFDAEYACARADEAYARAAALGFVPYCTRSSLGRLSDTPPPGLLTP